MRLRERAFISAIRFLTTPQRKMLKMKKPTADLDISSQIASN
jgi:hypothetical protein